MNEEIAKRLVEGIATDFGSELVVDVLVSLSAKKDIQRKNGPIKMSVKQPSVTKAGTWDEWAQEGMCSAGFAARDGSSSELETSQPGQVISATLEHDAELPFDGTAPRSADDVEKAAATRALKALAVSLRETHKVLFLEFLGDEVHDVDIERRSIICIREAVDNAIKYLEGK